ncbi:hypothetical protein HDU77_008385 [Chytriomyces hyalinus]|nr:hypothetical protein HDU77_008385 [Chytriomyces hyalinus]
MSRSHNNKRNKYPKHSVKSRANPAAAAVQATHAAHSVHSIVPEAALLQPISTQPFDASPVNAEVHVPQPPKTANSSASTTVSTKRCVRTIVYNTLSKYSHVPRYLKEPLRFERNVKPVSSEGRRLVCFFSEEEEPALSLPAENLTLAADTHKKEDFQPRESNQDCIKTTLISSGLAVCEEALDEKIVTLAHENHTINMLPKPAAPPQYFMQAKDVDTTLMASSANFKANNAEILTTSATSLGLAADSKPRNLKIVTLVKSRTPDKLYNCPDPQEGLTKENMLSVTAVESAVKPKEKNTQVTAIVCEIHTLAKPTNRRKIDLIIADTPCKTNTTIKMEQIAPTKNAPEAIKHNLLLADSAVNLIALDVTNRAPKPKTKKAAKNQSRGQKRASLAKAAKFRHT